MERPWWRHDTLNPRERELFEALSLAHFRSTFRQNPSAVAVEVAAYGSGSYTQSIAAALLTFGGLHGPLVATYDLLTTTGALKRVHWLLDEGQLVPGWGNGFIKGKPDPLWEAVDELVAEFPISDTIAEVGRVMLERKGIYPNPSCYTAATAISLGIPREATPWLAIQARLPAWSQIFIKSKEVPEWAP